MIRHRIISFFLIVAFLLPLASNSTLTRAEGPDQQGNTPVSAGPSATPSADLSISTTASPSSVATGGVQTYTLSITNAGPNAEGAPVYVTTTNSSAPFNIPDYGPATAYPATVSFNGLQGTIDKVTVHLYGVYHPYANHLDVLLRGPGGQTTLLMSDAGGLAPIPYATLVFDDAASGYLPFGPQIQTGVYKPTDYNTDADNFPSPAPAGPWGSALSVFNGRGTNGSWKLYVADEVNTGIIGYPGVVNGWDISVRTVVTPTVPVTVTDILPPGVTFSSASGTGWSCSAAAGVVTCTRPSLVLGPLPDINVVVNAPVTGGVIVNTASVTSTLPDDNPADNTSQITTLVEEPITNLLATNDSPTPVGSLTNLTATVGSGTNVSYSWAFGDGANASGANVSHSYAPAGIYAATVTATNGLGNVTATTTVTAVNTPPVAVDDVATINQDTAVDIPVRDNDFDPNGDILRVTAVSTPLHGSASISGSVSVVYTPTLDFSGTDVFSYTISDTGDLTATATVTVTVLPVYHPPAELILEGPTLGTIRGSDAFTVTVAPVKAALPITYVWEATGQSPLTHTNGLSDTASFTWNLLGSQAITVTATNVAGTISSTLPVTIEPIKVYLPIVLRGYTGAW